MRTALWKTLALGATIAGMAVASGAPLGAQGTREALVVSTGWLADHLKDANLVILQLGVKAEYDAGHIPGARFITLDDVAVTDRTDPASLTLQMPAADDLRARLERIGVSDNSRVVMSYGRDRIASATRVLFTLDHAGLGARASVLDGGSEAWARERRPMSTEVPAPATGKLAALTTRPSIVDAAFVRSHLSSPGFVVIDGRTKAFYDGVQTGGSAERPHKTGHIAGAKNVPYTDTLTSEQLLQPAETLASMFKAAGVKPGDTIIGYCHIGQQATAMLFAARTLGFSVLLYDGSFEDWSRQTDYPVDNPSKK
jgi:thiosulfate/3-mercaptopyruvate sulfurtransferase